MRRILLSALLAASMSPLALPAVAAETYYVQGILVEPRHPTTSDRIRLTVVGVEPGGCWDHSDPVYENPTDTVVLRIEWEDCVATPIQQPFRRTYEIGPLEAGQHFAEVRFPGIPGYTRRELFEVSEDTALLGLGEDDRFQFNIHWSNPRDGSSGTGHARRLSKDSGAFWFFSPDNLEVTVKVIDGRAVNGKWWVFIASMTDLELRIRAEQLGSPPGSYVKTYIQDAGRNRNVIDVDAFSERPVLPPVSGKVLTTPEIVIDPERPNAGDPIHVEVAVLNTEPDIHFTEVDGHSIFFDYESYGYPADRPFPPYQRFTAETTVGPFLPGVYTVDVRLDTHHAFGRTFEVAVPNPQLFLRDTADSHFNVIVQLEPPLTGSGYGVPLTRESGYFWFFDPDNIELTVKILDGRGVNGKYWVFISSMTDVAFTAHVQQCPDIPQLAPCVAKTYRSVQGVNQNIIDVNFSGL